MEREQDPKPIPVQEVLKEWLVNNGIPEISAQLAVYCIDNFCSRRISKLLDCSVEVGIAVKVGKYKTPHVWLYLLSPTPFQVQTDKLSEPFSKEVSIPSRPNLSIHLELVSPDAVPPGAFETKLREVCEEDQATYLGVFSKVNSY